MSHFSVLVLGDNIEEQLAPYHEFECTGYDDSYVQDLDITEQTKAEFNNATCTRVLTPNGKDYLSTTDDLFYREPTKEELKKIKDQQKAIFSKTDIDYITKDWKDGKGNRHKVYELPKGYKEVTVAKKEIMSFYQYVSEYLDFKSILLNTFPDLKKEHKYGYAVIDENQEVIKIIHRTNPNSKWDWYVIGGRFSGLLITKEGLTTDQAKAGNIDFNKIKEKNLAIAKENWNEFQASDKPYKYYYFDVCNNETAEEYLSRKSKFTTYALIKDKKWYEKGTMGWWGVSTNEKDPFIWESEFNKLLENLDPETLVTVVDCHI